MKTRLRSGWWMAAILLASCSKSNEPVQGTYQLNANSVVEWKGTNPDGIANNGTFQITENHVDVVNGQVKGGYFLFPIATLENLNLTDIGQRTQFLTHLKSSDFFNLVIYPEASFVIRQVKPYTGDVPGAVANANLTIEGNFMMLGKSLPVSFPAWVNVSDNAVSLEAVFMIDRTRWGMNYGLDPTKGMLIDKEVEIKLKLTAAKQ